MTEVRFYHLQTQSVQQALPVMLQKALERGQKSVLKFSDTRAVEAMNAYLWTYDPASFLPHGSAKDGEDKARYQPVWLTTGDENPNNAYILFLCGGATAENLNDFTLCCEMLEDGDEAGVQAARGRWKAYQEAGHEVTYWKQNARGGWDKKG